jgi:hypothetical protein
MKNQLTFFVLITMVFGNIIPVAAQTPGDEVKNGRLLKRKIEHGVDNYAYATYSFRFGGNGPEIQQLCRNNWDILFGNSPSADAFEVTMVTDDRSRIKDLGIYNWGEKFDVPTLAAYEEPEREPSVKAIEGHMYMVHTRDRDTNLYALFRVEMLLPGEMVEISWKVISPPKRP